MKNRFFKKHRPLPHLPKFPGTTKLPKIAPTGTASFLWNAMEQKDIVDGGTGVYTSHTVLLQIKTNIKNKR